MIYTIVSVRDRAADAFGRPIFVNSIGQAIRSFQNEINRKGDDNEMNRHPEDFDLYTVGTFDDTKGRFHQEEHQPDRIAIGKDLTTKE